jgi:hypothetical protein
MPSESTRVLTALGCGLAADWILWLSGSGNSRYFLPMACVAAVVIAGLLFQLFATRPKVFAYLLATILGVQTLQLWMGTEFRWNPVPWGDRWFDIGMPQKLRDEPSLYLTMGIQSNSFIAPFLARGSGLVNFSGGYALGPEGPSGARIEALIHRYAPHLRILVDSSRPYEDAGAREQVRSRADIALERFGLRVDASDCATITARGVPPGLDIERESSTPVEPRPRDASYLVSCHVFADNADHSALAARKRAADVVFDRLEDACPELFQPRGLRSDQLGTAWTRHYLNTDLMAWISHGTVTFDELLRGDSVVVGRESDWAKAPLSLVCERRDGHYSARVKQSKDRVAEQHPPGS